MKIKGKSEDCLLKAYGRYLRTDHVKAGYIKRYLTEKKFRPNFYKPRLGSDKA